MYHSQGVIEYTKAFGYNIGMKKLSLLTILILLFLSGCTQVVTAPVHFAGAVVTNTVEVIDTTVDAVVDDDEETYDNEVYYEE